MPLVYLESDPVCRATLEARISARDLEPAPILSAIQDIPAVKAAINGQTIDIITVGSPCSSMRSVDDMLAVLALVHAPLIFMQNDRNILTANSGNDYTSVLKRFTRLGYRVSWCVLSADQVGAWHRRKNWFAIAYKPATLRGRSMKMPKSYPSVTKFKWSMTSKPARTIGVGHLICDRTTDVRWDNKRRLRILSEAIVPDCTRVAFFYLFTGGNETNIRKRSLKHAQFDQGAVCTTLPFFGITSKPTLSRMHAHAHAHTSVLTALRKRSHVECRGMPHFHTSMNPRFVEFVMGFPQNWTSMRLPVIQQRRVSIIQ